MNERKVERTCDVNSVQCTINYEACLLHNNMATAGAEEPQREDGDGHDNFPRISNKFQWKTIRYMPHR